MIYTKGNETLVSKSAETRMFKITEVEGKFKLEWQPYLEEAFKMPRYRAWFSAIDLVRQNAEVTINVRCSSNSGIDMVAMVIAKCVDTDIYTNHIVNQCFFELGIM